MWVTPVAKGIGSGQSKIEQKLTYRSVTFARAMTKLRAMSFGDELRRVREATGLTQEKLAFRAGLSPEYVNRLETHKKAPSLEVFLRLCQALAVSPGSLLAPIAEHFERYGTLLPKAAPVRPRKGRKTEKRSRIRRLED